MLPRVPSSQGSLVAGAAGPHHRQVAFRLLPEGWRVPLLAALLFRVLWLWIAWGGAFLGDEPHYLRLGAEWMEAGSYDGQWPPLFPLFLRGLFEELPAELVPSAGRVLLSLLSVWSGAWLMAIGAALGGRRVGLCVGWLWAFYLPHLPFAHELISEGLNMALMFPAIALLVHQVRRQDGKGALAKTAIAGGLLGACCLTRESSAAWWLMLGWWACAQLGRRHGLVLLGAGALVIGAWCVPRSVAAGALRLPGQTSGLNAYMGWNALYINFDLMGLDLTTRGTPGTELRASLLELPEGVTPWEYSYDGSCAERNERSLKRGLRFVGEHPAYIARTRLVKAADLFSPLSEFTGCMRQARRRDRLGKSADAPIAAAAPRRNYGWQLDVPYLALALASLAALMSIAMLILGAAGTVLFHRVRTKGAPLLPLIAAGFAATLSQAALVSMTRLRAPWEALLLVPASVVLVALAEKRRPRASAWAYVGLACCITALAFLWFISAPAVTAVLAECLP